MISQTIVSYGDLSFLIMAAVRHLELLKNTIFYQLIGLSGLICVVMPQFMAISQTIAEMQLFLTFVTAAVRHLEFLNVHNYNGP